MTVVQKLESFWKQQGRNTYGLFWGDVRLIWLLIYSLSFLILSPVPPLPTPIPSRDLVMKTEGMVLAGERQAGTNPLGQGWLPLKAALS